MAIHLACPLGAPFLGRAVLLEECCGVHSRQVHPEIESAARQEGLSPQAVQKFNSIISEQRRCVMLGSLGVNAGLV